MLELSGSKRVNPTISVIFKTMCPTAVLNKEAVLQKLEDILNGSAKGYEGNLNLGLHPIDIERGPTPEDRV
ncbi:hypothetical protein Bca4012_020292 [Brassica carinata]